jgi:hypothetical protein
MEMTKSIPGGYVTSFLRPRRSLEPYVVDHSNIAFRVCFWEHASDALDPQVGLEGFVEVRRVKTNLLVWLMP